MTNSKETPKPLGVDNFPPEYHRNLKIIAAHRGITIRAAVIEAVHAWIEAQFDGGAVRVPPLDGKAKRAARDSR